MKITEIKPKPVEPVEIPIKFNVELSKKELRTIMKEFWKVSDKYNGEASDSDNVPNLFNFLSSLSKLDT